MNSLDQISYKINLAIIRTKLVKQLDETFLSLNEHLQNIDNILNEVKNNAKNTNNKSN